GARCTDDGDHLSVWYVQADLIEGGYLTFPVEVFGDGFKLDHFTN
ncbi:MAG: hypothetical protein JNL98_35110, partial [Bryobacterales bacterium]|nr:hypothetical protein [Bryobacterales bacterium]